MKLGLDGTIIKSKLDSHLGYGEEVGSSNIDVTVRKSPYIFTFFGSSADHRGGVVGREGC